MVYKRCVVVYGYVVLMVLCYVGYICTVRLVCVGIFQTKSRLEYCRWCCRLLVVKNPVRLMFVVVVCVVYRDVVVA